jgi:hypothetical protein
MVTTGREAEGISYEEVAFSWVHYPGHRRCVGTQPYVRTDLRTTVYPSIDHDLSRAPSTTTERPSLKVVRNPREWLALSPRLQRGPRCSQPPLGGPIASMS